MLIVVVILFTYIYLFLLSKKEHVQQLDTNIEI